jgi:hypothetical protein
MNSDGIPVPPPDPTTRGRRSRPPSQAHRTHVECICSLTRLSLATISIGSMVNLCLTWHMAQKVTATGGSADELVKLLAESQSSFGSSLVAVTVASISGSAASGYAARRSREGDLAPSPQ